MKLTMKDIENSTNRIQGIKMLEMELRELLFDAYNKSVNKERLTEVKEILQKYGRMDYFGR